ncbi:hypothetical protein WG66_006297 [Moniliophthora roreri]|nr:hypothetical protein WG66_006297 [Moniliophthora roreri]
MTVTFKILSLPIFPMTHSCLSPTTISLSAIMSFVNSSHTIITGENTLNHFQGNEVNSTINADTVYFNTSQAVTKRTECDQFREVIRGDMIKVKELHSEEFSEWDWEWRNGELVGRCKSSAQRTIYTVKIVDRQSKFTAMVYEGKDAQDFWEKDFQLFSHTHNPQLFGINQSAIPALIFHHGSLWMNVYIQHLRTNMRCWDTMLWMNTTSGVLLCGPDGPATWLNYSSPAESIDVPSTIDMLKDDTSFRFFSKFGRSVDDSVLNCALPSSKPTFLDDLFPRMADKDADHPDWSSAMPCYLRGLWRNPPDHLPMDVIGGLRFDTVYSPSLEAVARPREARSLWEWCKTDGVLMVETELNGWLIPLIGALIKGLSFCTRDLTMLTVSYEMILESDRKTRSARKLFIQSDSLNLMTVTFKILSLPIFPMTHSCLSPTTISLSAIMSFVNSSHTIITGENTLNHFQGNEVNSTINADTVYFNTSQAVTKRTECDQFREVIRGDMIKVKELHSEEFSEWDWEWRNGELVGRCKSSAQRTIYTVKIVDRQSKFTAMVYEGKDAQDFWEKDFQLFSHTHNPQLFGINQSAIPALIFHHELIPCAHFYTGSLWMNVYIQHLRQNMGCIDEMLWMNTTTGVLFCGPDGPSTQFPYLVANKSIVVPHTIDMLKDDTSFRFFSKFGRGVDYSVLECALLSSKPTFLDNLSPQMAEDHQSKDADHPDWSPAMPQCLRSLWRNPPAHIPMDIIGGLRFDTIYSPSLEAVARRPQDACLLWKWWDIDGLVDRTELDGGLVRFKLDLAQRKGALDSMKSMGKDIAMVTVLWYLV